MYVNLKKYAFCMERIIFLGYVVIAQSIEMDEKKVKAIQDWPTPKLVSGVRIFHGFVSFYRQFLNDFSTLVELLNEIVKKLVGFNGIMNKNLHLIYWNINYVVHLFLSLLYFTKAYFSKKVKWSYFELSHLWQRTICFGKSTWNMIALLMSKRVHNLFRSWILETSERTR